MTTMPSMRTAFEVAAIAVALVLVGVMAWLLADADGLLLASGQPVFGDFIAFWSAGRAVLDGHAAQVHEVALIRHYHQIAVPGVAFVAPWNSPPTFLLIATALALLPYPAAALVFLAATGALYLYAARKLLPDARALIFAATLPAAVYHLGTVQVGLLIAGVSALALHWLDRRPLAAGALVSLLAIKPHLAILWPLLLALSGRWRAFAAAAACTLAFVVVSGLAFGFDAHLRFLANLAAAQDLVSAQRTSTPAHASLYASLLGFGAPQTLAIAVHGASALAALAAALPLFRRGGLPEQGAALCAATLLVLPYVFFYDFTLLAVGAALLGAPRDRFETLAVMFAWSAGLSLALGYLAPLPLCPLASWLVLMAAARRARGAAYPRRRSPTPAR
jgi:hypothetical protein